MIKKFAYRPFFKVPTLSLCPSIAAGITVKASNALVLSKPYLIAFFRFLSNSETFLSLKVVNANSILFFDKTLRFVGA